jgi:hypothetical protein
MIVVAIVLELGSVCLLLLVAGPAMEPLKARRAAPRAAPVRKSGKGSKAAAAEPPAEKPKELAILPVQAESARWLKERSKTKA